VILESRDDLKNIPTDPKSLVKLIIQDGADVHTADYSGMTNIVQIKNFGSRADLQQVLAEEFAGAEAVSFDPRDFLIAYMGSQGIDEAEQQEILALQMRIKEAA
jgi:hypothetical protein